MLAAKPQMRTATQILFICLFSKSGVAPNAAFNRSIFDELLKTALSLLRCYLTHALHFIIKRLALIERGDDPARFFDAVFIRLT